MKVLVCPSAGQAKQQAAARLVDQVRSVPGSVLGLATGGTMEAVYAHLVAQTKAQSLSWKDVTTFNLDEYWGIAPDSPASYRSYMQGHLFDHIDITPAATHLPASTGRDPEAAAQAYEEAIAAAGGIDLQLLGIGKNGHIGFNEPTSSLGSLTRIKTLTENTRLANRRFFDRLEDVPKFAITVGIATILSSKSCLVVATGAEKAAAVKAMIEGPVSASCPASALQMHRHVSVLIDPAAAGALDLLDYYQHVHPDGHEPEALSL